MTAPVLQKISECRALVVDGNPTSRSILVSQLREYGVGKVMQCTRVLEARSRLEHAQFDFVLCEQNFADASYSGQDLLDDLRRAQLLPFSTVFFMVTGEASYAIVAEAAESALDGYLLKPFTASALFDRLQVARLRKAHLKPIFSAIEAQRFDDAAQLCLERFEKRAPYWLYAARIGTELLLRLNRHEEARILCEAVIAAKALPWAKLGVARVHIEAGHTAKAMSTLERLVGEDSGFADAYDVMGSAQVELGKFDEALETYRMAAELTPGSVVRLQKHGMMAYYMGDRATAARVLARAAMLGADSKMFDAQSLVLLAFASFQDGDRKTLDRCAADFQRLMEKAPDDARLVRFSDVVATLRMIQLRQFATAVASVRAFAGTIRDASFDFEAACNLGGLLSVLAATSIELGDSETWIQTLGLRYASSRGLGELLARACVAYEPHVEMLRTSHARINKMAETSMALSLAGDPGGAVLGLLADSEATLNAKLVDVAQQVLTRHGARIDGAAGLHVRIAQLRDACGSQPRRAALTQDKHRQPGGLNLRVAPPAEALATVG
ncbi:tetratricopeptide repeat-containing response regulator [Xylophilus sp. Leaf220]|uniref:tetratricopeptide repeat-containing response regulator n=1 Tax=Xylophilus sp. Leaf220 TaxID=1735686 RepID=UPI0006F34065|nr:tetratricopeptide repeat-containing response regulator [Xylophilus sp. Leaf220]KQM71188.1 response regulator receiver protein [Xylophilus sp. Leaf220]